ncbi:signal peptidase I [Pedococcus sp. P5_B7]
MSGTPRDGDNGWLRFEADQPDPTRVETDAAHDSHDPAWLRHDLPDPSPTVATDAGAAAPTHPPDSPWLPSDVEVARPTPTPEDAHDTGVPPTIVGQAEESTPARVTTETRPLPEEIPVAAARDESAPQDDEAGADGEGATGRRDDGEGAKRRRDDEGAKGRRDDDESVSGLAVLGAAIKEFAIVVGMALVLSFIVKTWLLQAFYIPSGSMEDTLVLNDRVIVSKLTPGPIDLKRGDIVVFADPGQWLDEAPKAQQGPVATVVTETLTFVGLLPDNAENHLIKRVIGLPGDHVVCCDEGGRITINGTAIKEPYLKPGDAASEQDFDITVPSGRVWVMGDHRSNSADSRVHDGPENNGSQGSVDERLVVGRAVALVWPLDHLTWLSNPTSTFAQVPAPSPATATTDSQGAGVTGDGPGGGEVGGTDTPTGSG